MKQCIKEKLSVKTRQWLWFIALWCAGLMVVLTLSYLIRSLIHFGMS